MKHLLVVCIIIFAAVFGSADEGLSCRELTTRANVNATTLVVQWVDQCITLYNSSTTFGGVFTFDNETEMKSIVDAHVAYYGSLINCTGVDPSFPTPANKSMQAVHAIYNISAAQFNEYVKLTHKALQSVTRLFISETDALYRLFNTFRIQNASTDICATEDCNVPVTNVNVLAASKTFDYEWLSLTSTRLNVTSDVPVELYLFGQDLCNGTTTSSGVIEFNSLSEGTYYLFNYNALCVSPSKDWFNQTVLIINYAPPVQSPIAAPPLVANGTQPISEPVAQPMAQPVSEPVTPPVPTPVAEPVTVTPVAPPKTADAGNSNSGFIAAIVILVLLVVGLLIAVIILALKLRHARPPTMVT